MGKDAPIISKALRLVSFSLTLVAIIIFVTIGYSATQVFQGVISSGDALKVDQRITPEGVDLAFNLKLPNKGVYPLELDLVGETSVDKVSIGKVVSGPHVIPPGETKQVEFVVPMRLGSISDKEFVKKLLFQDSNIVVNITTRIGFQPFAFVNVSSGFANPVGSVFSGLKIEQERVSPFNATHSLMELKVSYANKSPIPFLGKMTLVIVSTPTRSARGVYGATTVDVSTNSGDAIVQTIFIPIRNNVLGAGNYQVEVSVTAGPISASTETAFRGR